MRRFFFAAVFGGAATIVVALIVGSLVQVAHAQVRPGRGGGGGGVALQPTVPGTMQTGNINISGSVCLGCGTGTTGMRMAPAQNNGVSFSPQGLPTQSGQPAANFTDGNGRSVSLMRYQDLSLGIGGPDGLGTTIATISGATSLHLEGQPNSGFPTLPNVVIEPPSGVTMTVAPILRMDNPKGTQKVAFGFDGTPSFAVPVPQASGGTGTGATTCAAGQFLTSNGTTYSCAALPTGSAIASVTLTFAATNVAGSLCVFGTPAVAPAGVSVGMGCLMNFVGQMSTACSGVTCPTMECTTFAGSGPNAGQTMYETRFCNTGTNTDTAPAGNYVLHFIPP